MMIVIVCKEARVGSPTSPGMPFDDLGSMQQLSFDLVFHDVDDVELLTHFPIL